MLKKILIPLDASKYTQVATREAAEIARKVQALNGNAGPVLEGLGIVDTEQIPSGRFASLVPRDQILADARETVKDLLEQFKAQLRELSIPEGQISCRMTEGEPFQKIVHHHVFADLLVMGSVCAFPPAVRDYETFVNLLYHTSRPVLLVPERARSGRKVLMLMDGTAASSRMMYAFTHLNPFPGAEVLVVHSSYEEEYHELKDFFERVHEYLHSYGLNAEDLRVQGHLLENLPGLIAEHGADVVAAGIHAEEMLHKIGRGLHLFPLPLEALMNETGVSLFTTH